MAGLLQHLVQLRSTDCASISFEGERELGSQGEKGNPDARCDYFKWADNKGARDRRLNNTLLCKRLTS
ncbi:hypothetical protein GQ600_6990 [Phytophthora cactorum]|nr:hypothetical protein GQ600_6990 [Phytophthora cactorum]